MTAKSSTVIFLNIVEAKLILLDLLQQMIFSGNEQYHENLYFRP